MPETTESYHRIPVDSGDHGDHKVRTIVVSEGQGIKALYCVDCSKIITYLFDVDKWTMDEAKKWVSEHKDDSKSMSNRDVDSFVRFKSYGTISTEKGLTDGGPARLYVRGFFTDDKQDEMGDVITRAATERAVERWRQWGNIRTMHQNPSGKIEKIGLADGLAWNEVVTVPVDKQTAELIEGGVLKAYSVGIIPKAYEPNFAAMSEDDPWWYAPIIIHDYDMIEISYVDHPANYSARITDVAMGKMKYDGARAVVYKNYDFGVVKMEDELEVVEADVTDPDIEESVAMPDTTKVDGENVDISISEDESPEMLFDAESAVRSIELQLSEIKTYVENMIDVIVDKVLERVVVNEEPGEDSNAVSVEPVNDQVTASVIENAVNPLDEYITHIDSTIDKRLKEFEASITSLLSPATTRRAIVTVDEDNEGEEKQIVDAVRRYMGMSGDERRVALRDMLKEHYQ